MSILLPTGARRIGLSPKPGGGIGGLAIVKDDEPDMAILAILAILGTIGLQCKVCDVSVR